MTRPSEALRILRQLIDEGINDDDSLYIVIWSSRPYYPTVFYHNIERLRKRFKHAFLDSLSRALIIKGRFVALAVFKLAERFGLEPRIFKLGDVNEK